MSCSICNGFPNCPVCSEEKELYEECYICGQEARLYNKCLECGEYFCEECRSKENGEFCVDCYEYLKEEGFVDE